MRWPAIMGVSIAAHAAVIVTLPGERAPAMALPEAPVVTLEPLPEVVEVTPFEVVVLPATVAAPAERTGDRQPATGNRQPAMRRDLSIAGRSPATSAAEPAPGPSRFATMRFEQPPPEVAQLDLSISGSVLDEIMNRPVPEIPTPTGELIANKDGTHTKKDLVFTATIHEDGTVDFEDKPNFHIGLKVPSVRAIKKHLAAWAEDPFGNTPGEHHEGASDDDDDDVFILPIITGGFDITDAVERLAGNDPYSARKAAFLERTFDERAELGRKHRVEQLEEAEAYILGHARKLWKRTDLTIAEKRELLFELWDDCAETGDDELVEAGDRARAALLRFIDVRLPVGSDDAFSAAEIERLDRRRHSKTHFAPY